MSQIDFIRATVADFFDELEGEGIADPAVYTNPNPPKGGSADSNCRVLVKRGVGEIGAYGHLTSKTIVIRIVLGDLPVLPAVDGLITVTSDAFGTEVFRLVRRLSDNGAIADWTAENAPA